MSETRLIVKLFPERVLSQDDPWPSFVYSFYQDAIITLKIEQLYTLTNSFRSFSVPVRPKMNPSLSRCVKGMHKSRCEFTAKLSAGLEGYYVAHLLKVWCYFKPTYTIFPTLLKAWSKLDNQIQTRPKLRNASLWIK